MPDTPLRGRRGRGPRGAPPGAAPLPAPAPRPPAGGRDRRIAERVATDFAARHARPSSEAEAEAEVDFDVAAVDAEVEDARRGAPAPPNRTAPAPPRGRPPITGRKGAGHRLPDLSA